MARAKDTLRPELEEECKFDYYVMMNIKGETDGFIYIKRYPTQEQAQHFIDVQHAHFNEYQRSKTTWKIRPTERGEFKIYLG